VAEAQPHWGLLGPVSNAMCSARCSWRSASDPVSQRGPLVQPLGVGPAQGCFEPTHHRPNDGFHVNSSVRFWVGQGRVASGSAASVNSARTLGPTRTGFFHHQKEKRSGRSCVRMCTSSACKDAPQSGRCGIRRTQPRPEPPPGKSEGEKAGASVKKCCSNRLEWSCRKVGSKGHRAGSGHLDTGDCWLDTRGSERSEETRSDFKRPCGLTMEQCKRRLDALGIRSLRAGRTDQHTWPDHRRPRTAAASHGFHGIRPSQLAFGRMADLSSTDRMTEGRQRTAAEGTGAHDIGGRLSPEKGGRGREMVASQN
jgi:hypothetical protein